jgi:hypothetical protein
MHSTVAPLSFYCISRYYTVHYLHYYRGPRLTSTQTQASDTRTLNGQEDAFPKQLSFEKHSNAETKPPAMRKIKNNTTSKHKQGVNNANDKADQPSRSSEHRSSVVVYGNTPT